MITLVLEGARSGKSSVAEVLLAALAYWRGDVVIVPDEVGPGVYSLSEVPQSHRDALGGLNQLVAERAYGVFLAVAGQLMTLKAPGAR